MEFQGDNTTFNINTNTSNGGTLKDYTNDSDGEDVGLYDLLARWRNYSGSWWNYYGPDSEKNEKAYKGIKTTRGFNTALMLCYVQNAKKILRGGGTVEVNGSDKYEGWLTDLGFGKANPWEWKGTQDTSRPYLRRLHAPSTPTPSGTLPGHNSIRGRRRCPPRSATCAGTRKPSRWRTNEQRTSRRDRVCPGCGLVPPRL